MVKNINSKLRMVEWKEAARIKVAVKLGGFKLDCFVMVLNSDCLAVVLLSPILAFLLFDKQFIIM